MYLFTSSKPELLVFPFFFQLSSDNFAIVSNKKKMSFPFLCQRILVTEALPNFSFKTTLFFFFYCLLKKLWFKTGIFVVVVLIKPTGILSFENSLTKLTCCRLWSGSPQAPQCLVRSCYWKTAVPPCLSALTLAARDLILAISPLNS